MYMYTVCIYTINKPAAKETYFLQYLPCLINIQPWACMGVLKSGSEWQCTQSLTINTVVEDKSVRPSRASSYPNIQTVGYSLTLDMIEC